MSFRNKNEMMGIKEKHIINPDLYPADFDYMSI